MESDSRWTIYCLRYFDVIGHKTYFLRDNTKNIMHELYRIYSGYENKLLINNYNQGKLHDFIHVDDLADAHECITTYIRNAHIVKLEEGHDINGIHIFNIGSGKGTTIKELIMTFEIVNKCKIKQIGNTNKKCDNASSKIANVDKIYNILGWKAKYTLEEMVML